MVLFSKPAVAGIMFFCLETKEPKIQECRIASGRHSALRAWMETFLIITFLVAILKLAFARYAPYHAEFIEGSSSNQSKFISIKEASAFTLTK